MSGIGSDPEAARGDLAEAGGGGSESADHQGAGTGENPGGGGRAFGIPIGELHASVQSGVATAFQFGSNPSERFGAGHPHSIQAGLAPHLDQEFQVINRAVDRGFGRRLGVHTAMLARSARGSTHGRAVRVPQWRDEAGLAQ